MTCVSRVGVVVLSILAVQACGGAAPPAGGGYPDKPVTIIIPFGVGGGSDVLSRTLANVIQETKLLPVPLLVENRPGGSGAIGYGHIAGQRGNPYILATVSVSFFTTPLLGASSVNYTNFTPVAAVAMSPYIMVVRTASPIRSVADATRAKRLTTGAAGVVSDPVLLAHLLQKATGVTIDTVPFDGEGEVLTAALGGHLDFLFGNPGEILPQIEAGTLRPLAVSTAERLPSLPDVPTFRELGYAVEHVQLRGVIMPPGVAAEEVAYWERTLRAVTASDAWKRTYLDRFKDEPRFVGASEFGAILESTNALYAQMMAEVGLIK